MKKCLSLTLGNNTAHLPYIVTCVYKLTVDFTFQNGHALLAHFEFSSAAQTSDAAQSLPSQTGLVVLGTCNQENQKHLNNMTKYVLKSEFNITGLIFAGVGFDNLAVKPHMGNGHSVLCQGSCLI